MKVTSREEAWKKANDLFPTDYEYDTLASKNAGYPIYYSTAYGVNAWISDLNCSLELNMPDGTSLYINIEKPKFTEWNYDGQY